MLVFWMRQSKIEHDVINHITCVYPFPVYSASQKSTRAARDAFSITEVFNAIFVTRDVEVNPAFPGLGIGAPELRARVQVTI